MRAFPDTLELARFAIHREHFPAFLDRTGKLLLFPRIAAHAQTRFGIRAGAFFGDERHTQKAFARRALIDPPAIFIQPHLAKPRVTANAPTRPIAPPGAHAVMAFERVGSYLWTTVAWAVVARAKASAGTTMARAARGRTRKPRRERRQGRCELVRPRRPSTPRSARTTRRFTGRGCSPRVNVGDKLQVDAAHRGHRRLNRRRSSGFAAQEGLPYCTVSLPQPCATAVVPPAGFRDFPTGPAFATAHRLGLFGPHFHFR